MRLLRAIRVSWCSLGPASAVGSLVLLPADLSWAFLPLPGNKMKICPKYFSEWAVKNIKPETFTSQVDIFFSLPT